ncbi:DDE-type integrase/transposase/recombinase [Amycolatopsis aidingensis]|uniref:DDE-type integrase/transposase/recombinase n=1 Tax=Amycolatopsis aidingensis TaxID=2842453 RepID=UPI001C0B6EBC|nr:DDE-type integrase/transposase/recombinase [Amycolatopsis aidingensis]
MITEIHQSSHGIHGSRRVHAELRLGRGVVVGHGAVEMLMHRAGLAGAMGRPKWQRAKPDEIARDWVKRDFTAGAPNRKWAIDITEHHTREGKVDCAVVLDVYSRRVVGWSIDSSPTAALVTYALGMAIDTRTPSAGGDHPLRPGCAIRIMGVYQACQGFWLVPSLGSVGDCYDSAMMESFWSRMQVELLDRQRWHPHRVGQRDLRVP